MFLEKALIYGVDKVGSSDPNALVRTDYAVGLSYTVGATDIISDFDRCYPWSDMQEVMDEAGNVFIKIPKFYSKITKNADGTYKHQLSGLRYEGFSTLFVDGKGNELDYVLVGKYEGSGSAERIYSKSGQNVLVNITCDNFRTGCRANGIGYQQYDFLIDLIIKELWLVEMKTTNSQSIMYGYAKANSAAIQTGRTDTISTSSGSDTSNTDGKHAMKYRGIENLWGNAQIFIDGISFLQEKVYVSYDPTSYTMGKTALPYVYQGNRAIDTVGFIKEIKPLGHNPLIQWITEVGGAWNTYFCDNTHAFDSTHQAATGLVGGGWWQTSTDAGLWRWDTDIDVSFTSSHAGGRLCYKPV